MKIYKSDNVFEAGLERFRWLFDKFPDMVINVSGGKDSTVVWEMARIVAKEKGLLPIRTMFIDQEAEWESTIEMIKYMMYHEDTDPYWFQVPMLLSNATSSYEQWLQCWDPADEERWMRPKDPISIKENTFGTDRFGKLFGKMLEFIVPNGGANVAGVRCEESPGRMLALTTSHVYGGVTWGAWQGWSGHYFLFYPLYDWNYTDIWKAIHDNDWKYSRLYDSMYAYGIPIRAMRVSNVHHEQAVGSLFYMQEIEHETWEKLTRRIEGIDSAGKFGKADYVPKTLPYMFKDWQEYRDYLLPRLIVKEDWAGKMKKIFERHDTVYGSHFPDKFRQVHIEMIMTNDHEGVKSSNFEIGARQRLKKMGIM